MTAVLRGPVTAFVLRAGIITAILAILAGIFGMHVMTGNHSMHSPAAGHTPAPAVSAGDSHANHKTTAPHAEPVASTTAAAAEHRGSKAVAAGPASCTCSADCASIQAMSAACTPSAQTGTLAAPEPAQGTRTMDGHGGLPDPVGSSYAYLPGSPSPGELSISRT